MPSISIHMMLSALPEVVLHKGLSPSKIAKEFLEKRLIWHQMQSRA